MNKYNLLVTTTYKNNYQFSEYFFNFYTNVWKPRKFLFLCGVVPSIISRNDIISKFEYITKYQLKIKKKIDYSDNYINNVELYENDKCYLLLYDTSQNYKNDEIGKSKIWDHKIRPKILFISNKMINCNNFKYFITVDNDDFLYTKTPEKLLKNEKYNFHSLEYIPNSKFNINEDMLFTNYGYYYRYLGNNRKLINSHIYDRFVNFKNFYSTCSHKKNNKCNLYITEENNIDNIAFCFGCIDLDYLLNSKHWLQTTKTNTVMWRIDKDKIIHDFNKFYDKKELTCVRVTFLKKYFINNIYK